MANEKSSDKRARIWAAVVYPESAPQDWRSILDDYHIEWAESPLHDLDVNVATGEQKKPHWHIVLAFDGKKSYEQVAEILAPLHCPAPQKCHSLKGAVRYFAHMDNPEKAQYSAAAIVGHGGFDVAQALQPTSAKRYEMIAEMIAFTRDNGITEFQDLMDYAMAAHTDDWFPLLCDSCAFIMQQYIKSQRHRGAATAASPARAAGAPQRRACGSDPHQDDDKH